MKVLITSEWYIPIINGVVTSIVNLMKELEKRGHEVRILTLSDTRHSYSKNKDIYIGSRGVEKIYPGARIALPRNNRFIEELIDWKPDIIHSQSEFTTFLIARKISKRLDIPIIHTYHTIYEDYTHYFSPIKKWGKAMTETFTNSTLQHVHCVIAPSNKVKNLLMKYGVKAEIKVIPTGVDMNRYSSPVESCSIGSLRDRLGISSDLKTIIMVGRLAKEKNHEEVFHFLERLNNPGIRLVLVGDGPNRNQLEDLANRLGIDHQIVFTGMVPHEKIASYYQIGDVFMSASNSETQGLTYFEALSNGVPVICKKDDCVKDIIVNGYNGWQYETFEQFNEQFSVVLENPSGFMKNNAIESVVSRFSLEVFAKSILDAYHWTLLDYEVSNLMQNRIVEFTSRVASSQ